MSGKRRRLLALTRLEAALHLVDDVNPALAADQAVVAVTAAERFQRVTDLHGTMLLRKAVSTGRVASDCKWARAAGPSPGWPVSRERQPECQCNQGFFRPFGGIKRAFSWALPLKSLGKSVLTSRRVPFTALQMPPYPTAPAGWPGTRSAPRRGQDAGRPAASPDAPRPPAASRP